MRSAGRGLVLGVLVFFLAGTGAAGEGGDAPRLLRSRRAGDRREAVRILAGVSGRTAVRLLLVALADEDRGVRRAAARAVADRRAPDDLAAIREEGFGSRDPRVRLPCLRALVGADAPDLVDVLPDALADPDPGVREAAVGPTERVMGDRGIPCLAAAVRRGREGRPRAFALLALERLDAELARSLARELRSFPAMEVRVAALEVLSGGEPAGAMPLIAPGLEDDCWSVRLTAARGLVRGGTPGAVPALVDALGREEGRMREEIGAALASLTGVGLPADPERWARWWREEKDRFAGASVPAAPEPDPTESVATFHSIPVRSRAAAFVLDRSRSMARRVNRPGDGPTTKAALVEAELGRTLGRLALPARFLLVAFGTEVAAFSPIAVPVTPANRARALDWFAKRAPSGRTNLHDAIALALGDEDVDTLFVLTDGAPSEGEEQTRAGILESIGLLNRYRKAVIHTVEIGGETAGKEWAGFLAELARRNGGVHVRR